MSVASVTARPRIRGAKRGANEGRPRAMRGDLARRLLQLDGISGDDQRQSATDKLRLKSGRPMAASVGQAPARRLRVLAKLASQSVRSWSSKLVSCGGEHEGMAPDSALQARCVAS